MTTNCNDTCDAVDILLRCYSVQNKWICGAKFHQVVFQYQLNYPYSEKKTEIFFQASTFRENPLGALNFSILIEILHIYLKEFSPKPSTGMVSFCVSIVSMSSQNSFAELRLTSQPTFQRMWTD